MNEKERETWNVRGISTLFVVICLWQILYLLGLSDSFFFGNSSRDRFMK